MILPDLANEIAWWQANMRPSDPAFGPGLSDWTITAEYVPDLKTPQHGDVWGLTCSPSSLPALQWLTPEDIEAKRAHLQIRKPTTSDEVAEIEETLPHELVHVLDARKSGTVEDKENTAHSLAPLLAALRKNHPARAAMLARAIASPAMARAYRAKEGTMPDVQEEKKEPDNGAMAQEKPKGDKAPMAQEGGDLASLLMKAGELAATEGLSEEAKALLSKLASMATAKPVEPVMAPPEAATMGMKPEEAYARGQAAVTKEAIEAIVEANPHLSKDQAAMVRKQSTAKAARELVATYPRSEVKAEPEKAKMGMQGHPSTNGEKQAPMARACALPTDPMVRKAMGYVDASEDTGGVSLDVPGSLIVMDLHRRAAEAKARMASQTQKTRGAA